MVQDVLEDFRKDIIHLLIVCKLLHNLKRLIKNKL